MFDELIPAGDKYEVEEEVGHGTFSEVHRARERGSDALVALKVMFLREEEGGVLPRHVQREIRLLRTVQHPAVVSLLGVEQQGFSVALVLEHCLTDLRVLLASLRGAPLDKAVAKAVARQLLQALEAIHTAGFVHRDVAASNILIAHSGAVKLGDFGQARRLPGSSAGAGADARSQLPNGISSSGTAGTAGTDANGGGDVGPDEDAAPAPPGSLTPGAALCTRWYKAPELLFNARSYGAAVDMWGAGCVMAELLTGRPLFPGSSDIAQLALMGDLLGSISEERWPGVVELPDWGKLIFEDRPAQDLATAFPGLPPDAVQLLGGLLQYNPDHRLTAAQALRSPYFQTEPAPAPPGVLLAIVRQALA